MTIFKVGDRVERINDDNSAVCKVGDTGTIQSIEGRSNSIFAKVLVDRTGALSNCASYNLKLIEEKSMALPSFVAAGTLVRRINENYNDLKVGEVYIVKNDWSRHRSNFELEGYNGGFTADNFELASEAESEIAKALAILKAAGDVTFKPRKPAFKPREVVLSAAYTAVITDKNVKVGCQVIAFEAVDDIAAAVSLARKYAET